VDCLPVRVARCYAIALNVVLKSLRLPRWFEHWVVIAVTQHVLALILAD